MGIHVMQSHHDGGDGPGPAPRPRPALPPAVVTTFDGCDAAGRLHDWPVYNAIGRVSADTLGRLVRQEVGG